MATRTDSSKDNLASLAVSETKSNLDHPDVGTLHPQCEVFPLEFQGKIGSKKLYDRCTTNPGHEGFMTWSQFEQLSLPDCFTETNKAAIKNFFDRTVKITIRYTSRNRPDKYMNSNDPYPYSNMRGSGRERVGTGIIMHFAGEANVSRGWKCPCKECSKSSDSDKPRDYYSLSVSTATHVVYDDDEASRAVVSVFMDDVDREGESNLYGVRVFVPSSYFSIVKTVSDRLELMCITHDKDLAARIFQLDKDFINFKYAPGDWGSLGFIVSHPHGVDKRISMGRIHKRCCIRYDFAQDNPGPVSTDNDTEEYDDNDYSIYDLTDDSDDDGSNGGRNDDVSSDEDDYFTGSDDAMYDDHKHDTEDGAKRYLMIKRGTFLTWSVDDLENNQHVISSTPSSIPNTTDRPTTHLSKKQDLSDTPSSSPEVLRSSPHTGLSNTKGLPSSLDTALSNTKGLPPSPDTALSNIKGLPLSPDTALSNPEGLPPSPDAALCNTKGLPPSPDTALSNPEGLPSSLDTALSNTKGLPPSPDTALSNIKGLPSSPDTALSNPEGLPSSPDTALSNTKGLPPSPDTALSNIKGLPSSPDTALSNPEGLPSSLDTALSNTALSSIEGDNEHLPECSDTDTDTSRPRNTFRLPTDTFVIIPPSANFTFKVDYQDKLRFALPVGRYVLPVGSQFISRDGTPLPLPTGVEFGFLSEEAIGSNFRYVQYFTYDIPTCPGSSGALLIKSNAKGKFLSISHNTHLGRRGCLNLSGLGTFN